MSQRYIGGLIYNPPGGFSGYFDGSGDWLNTPANAAFTLGTGDYTIEMWVLLAAVGREHSLFDFRNNVNTSGAHFITTGDKLAIWNGSTVVGGTGASVPANAWTHIAYVRSSGSITAYLNGVAQWTAAYADNLSNNTLAICGSFQGLTTLQGYASNARVVKGSAVYTSAFTPPVGPLQAITNTSLLTCAYPTFRDGSSNNFTITVNGNTAVSAQNPFPQTQLPNPALGNQGNGVYSMSQYQALRSQNLWPAIDPYFDYVTLMLHGNGTNGAQNNTFLDSSTNNFTITRNGNTTQGTFTPYGSNWSNYFDGSGDSLYIPSTTAFDFNGDFTVEGWFNFSQINQVSTATVLFSTDVVNRFQLNTLASGNVIQFYENSGTASISVANPIVVGTWNHIALVRTGTTIGLFVNGSRIGSYTSSFSWDVGGLYIGQQTPGYSNHWFNGYASNVRVIKGSGPYDATQSTLTVPTSSLTAITNTSLLTCADNRFIDDSSNNFTITRNGDVSVQRFSPFNPTTPYAAGTIGGSGYFDGSGDYLDVGSNAALALGSGSFTVEAWVFPTSTNQTDVFSGSATGSQFLAYSSNSGNGIGLGRVQIAWDMTTGALPTVGQWNHIVWVRSGTNLSIFLNGTRVGNTTNSTNYGLAGGSMYVGAQGSPVTVTPTAYFSNVRVVVGTAVYDPTQTTLTVPTAPLTAITNTRLLLNFTNGGIIDNAMMNDLETVGNAQISTSVSKFGGGSLAFDGSGDYLLIPNSENFNFGAGNWTIEFWVRFNTVGTRQIIMSPGNSSGTNAPFYFELNNSLRLRFLIQTAATGQIFVDTSYTPNANQWYHLAGVRNGSTATFYVDGVAVGSVSPGTNALTAITNQLVIGDYIGLGFPLNGYIDDLRITKGYARYTANFTPQRSQWQDQ